MPGADLAVPSLVPGPALAMVVLPTPLPPVALAAPPVLLQGLQVYVSRKARRNLVPLTMYMRKLAAELMLMSRFDRVMIVSRAGMVSHFSSSPQKKPSWMSELFDV